MEASAADQLRARLASPHASPTFGSPKPRRQRARRRRPLLPSLLPAWNGLDDLPLYLFGVSILCFLIMPFYLLFQGGLPVSLRNPRAASSACIAPGLTFHSDPTATTSTSHDDGPARCRSRSRCSIWTSTSPRASAKR